MRLRIGHKLTLAAVNQRARALYADNVRTTEATSALCGDADTLIRAADRALYSAKGRGRNRVELFESGQDTVPAPAPAGS